MERSASTLFSLAPNRWDSGVRKENVTPFSFRPPFRGLVLALGCLRTILRGRTIHSMGRLFFLFQAALVRVGSHRLHFFPPG